MRVSASILNNGENGSSRGYSFALTTPTESCANSVNALLALDLVGDDFAALEDALLDVGRIVEDGACAVASDGSDGGDGESLAVDDDGLAMPVGAAVSVPRTRRRML